MTKKQYIAFLALSFTALIAVVIALMLFLNQPIKEGDVSVESNSVLINTTENLLKTTDGTTKSDYPPLDIAQIADTLETLEVGDGGIIVKYSEDYSDNLEFSMYDLDYNVVYENQPHFIHSENSGEYIVRIVVQWGQNDEEFIFTEHFFKLIYK